MTNLQLSVNPHYITGAERESIRQAAIKYDLIRNLLYTVCCTMEDFHSMLYFETKYSETVYVVVKGNRSVSKFISDLLPGARYEAYTDGICIRSMRVEVKFDNEQSLKEAGILK